MEPQTPDSSAGTQKDGSSDSAGSPRPNDAEGDASPNTAGSPVANNADTSTSHTALMESQKPELVSSSQGDASSTTASGSLADDGSTDAQSASTGASPSGTSAGISLSSNKWSHAALAVLLILGYIFLYII
jgi:hypothetical protein